MIHGPTHTIDPRRCAQTDPGRAGAGRPPTVDQAHLAPSRRGRKAVTFYLDPAGHQQLRMIGLETGRSAQSLLVEAANDLFQKHGKPRIAD